MSQQWISLEVDVKRTIKDLKELDRSQLPFALAAALTETAKLAQIGVQQRTRDVFKLHSEYIPKGVMVKPAKKADVKMGRGFAAVFTSRGITSFMAWHETGGKKRPRGKMLTVPGDDITKYRYRTNRGATAARWKAKKLLQGYQGERARGQRKKGRLSRKPFILPKHGGQPAMIARRITRGERGLEILYIFTPNAEIKGTWGFESTVRKVANKVFKTVFEQKWRQAVATAK